MLFSAPLFLTLSPTQPCSTLRQNGRDKKVVVATPRQLESLIRLSESRARMRLSEVVTQEDVSEAVSLWYRALSGSAGTSDGTIDMDNIFTGTTTAARHAHKSLPDDLRSLLASAGGGRPRSVDELLGEVQRASAAAGGSGAQVSRGQLVDALRMLDDVVSFDERTGVVRPRNGGGAPMPAV